MAYEDVACGTRAWPVLLYARLRGWWFAAVCAALGAPSP